MQSNSQNIETLTPVPTDMPQSASPCSEMASALTRECQAMVQYALLSGNGVSPQLLEELHNILHTKHISGKQVSKLGQIHQDLSIAIAPATPGGILAIQHNCEKRNWLRFLGPVPLVRHLTITTMLLLLTLICTSLSPQVNYQSISQGLLSSSGLQLVLNLMFLLSCSGLGGSFSLLYKLNQFIIDANYDPKFDSTYWVRLLLGIVAGLFLVELLPKEMFLNETSGEFSHFGKPALAMLGGFSATMVYRILQRLVDAMESIIKGDQQSVRKAESKMRYLQLEQQRQQMNMQHLSTFQAILARLEEGDTKGAIEMTNQSMKQLLTTSAEASISGRQN